MAQPLRVQHLAGYGLEVPDLQVAEDFFSAFGLRAQHQGQHLQLHSQATQPPNIVVWQGGAQKKMHHLSFAVTPADLPRFEAHLHSLGTPVACPPFAAARAGLWFQDPWGTWINLVPVATAPRLAPAWASEAARVDRHLWRELPRVVHPNKLGHLLMFTHDWEKTEAFYVQALGLRVTDRASGKVSFMSGGSGVRDHHCFGLIRSTHRGIQHGSFHVNTVDQIGLGARQMHQAGYTEGFGLGRHAIASNLFHYTRDPWGSWIEYYADMDQISEAWVAQDWHDLPYIWPDWAPEFWSNEMNANHEPR